MPPMVGRYTLEIKLVNLGPCKRAPIAPLPISEKEHIREIVAPAADLRVSAYYLPPRLPVNVTGEHSVYERYEEKRHPGRTTYKPDVVSSRWDRSFSRRTEGPPDFF